jgi:cyclic di-GMP phosphodiesterase
MSVTAACEVSVETLPILVVNDSPGLCDIIDAGLRDLGYRVDVAPDVASARELLRTRAYSLVLCDYEVQGGSGLELLAYMSRVHPDLPSILLTVHDDPSLARAAIASGALDFLPKPFKMRELARLIEQNRARVERQRERTAQLAGEVLTGTIRALVAAVDAKDPHTATHSQRVTELALRLGQAVNMPADRMRVLEFSALLHDVGKIAVPEGILLKEGRLDEADWVVLRKHPVRSAEIVNQVGALTEVATIVRHHHEKLDGTGYPDGLVGEAIPCLARVITIVDVYEALTSNRAYRRAMTPEQARDIIFQGLGTHFDRWLGEAFLSLDDLP